MFNAFIAHNVLASFISTFCIEIVFFINLCCSDFGYSLSVEINFFFINYFRLFITWLLRSDKLSFYSDRFFNRCILFIYFLARSALFVSILFFSVSAATCLSKSICLTSSPVIQWLDSIRTF